MTTKERARLRRVQDRFLSHPQIKAAIRDKGEDSPIAWGNGGSPSYKELRDMLYPKWVPWLEAFLADNPTA